MYLTPDNTHVIVPWRQDLAAVIPHAKPLDHQGRRYLLVPNRPDECRVARNLGIEVPPPILSRYDWCDMKPWETQKTTAALLSESRRAFVLNGMGTGKTRAAIWAADWLMRSGQARRALIIAPLSTLGPVWEAELFRVDPGASVAVLHGSKQARIEKLNSNARWLIINHHGLSVILDALLAINIDIVILDELAVFRNRQTKLWRSADILIQSPSTKFAWGMTGSPTPNAPTDAWAQVKLINPTNVPKSMIRFKAQTMTQLSPFKWVAKPEAKEVVLNAMQPSVRFSLEDVAELPPTSYIYRDIKLEPETAKAYKLMFDKMCIATKKGELITSANEGVLQTKLVQVASGYVYTDSKVVYQLPNQTRLDALLELIEETDRKVIVFVPYVHAVHGVTKFLQKHGHSVEMVYGGTAKGARDRIFRSFQDDPDPRILVAHPGCMSHGLTLVLANTIIWFAPINSLETYEQANARIVRPGQKYKTIIAHLVGTPVEKAIYGRLKTKSKLQGLLLAMFRGQKLEY